ncbi:MAG: hypothetical protein GX644_09835 [Limnobacter sp.]|nr:hypothetical protein [Limnobacter sp.]
MRSGLAVLSILLAGLPHAAGVAAADPGIRITAPADGATLDAMDQARLVYEVTPGPGADHVHVYVDGKEVGILRRLKGEYTLETLQAGKREICIKTVNKAHVPTGLEQCIQVTVD